MKKLTEASLRPEWPNLPTYKHWSELWSISVGPAERRYCSHRDQVVIEALEREGLIFEVIHRDQPCWMITHLGTLVLAGDIGKRWEKVHDASNRRDRIRRNREHRKNRVPWERRMVNYKAYNAWERGKRLRSPFAGLRFFTPCSGHSVNLASRHWPHLLCWSWIVSASWNRLGWHGRKFGGYAHRGQCGLNLYFVTLRAHWQSDRHMAGMNENAPQPIWDHDAKRMLESVDGAVAQ